MVRLIVGGDVMLGRGVGDVVRRTGPGHPLEPLASLGRAADLFFANLECALSDRDVRYAGPPKAFYFRAGLPAAETLAGAGMDLVALANNHALDADIVGLRDTLHILQAKRIAHVGAGANREAAGRPARLTSRGQQFGVLACCDHQPDFAATNQRPGIRYVDVGDRTMMAELEQDVHALAALVDHVVVSCHWQLNWAPEVSGQYRAWGRSLVAAGARIVWGHGPHHFQGVEWIDRNVVLYSTGDLLDDYAVDPHFRNDRQLLFELTLDRAGVRTVRALPIELDFARTRPAAPEASGWIERRFRHACGALGSRVERDGSWLEVRAAAEPSSVAASGGEASLRAQRPGPAATSPARSRCAASRMPWTCASSTGSKCS
jgi:poly-gamma-glutamate synthesis protein (capsule biosynthesis protein)